MTASVLYVLRNLGRRRIRTLVGVLGIFLTLALLTAIQIGLDSVSTSYIDLVALQAGKADLLITRRGGDWFNPQPLDPAQVRARVETNPHLHGLSPRFFGLVQVSFNGQDHDAALIGLDPQRERELDISGLSPEPALRENTCAISRSLADKLSAKPGKRLFLRSANASTELSLHLESLLERQLILPQQVRDYVVVDVAAARELLGETDRVHVLAGALRNPRAYYDARDLHASVVRLKNAGAAIAADLGMDYEVRLPKAAAITAFQNVTSPLRAIFGVFALLALTITGLLIYSLISVAVEERIREYAILRTLGAKQRDIFLLVLSESLVLCFLGVVPGVLAGTLFARGILQLVGLVMGAKGAVATLEVAPATLWLTVGAGVALSIGSALLPALHATRWRIVDALDPARRGQLPDRPPREGQVNRPLLVTGLVLSALSVVVFFVLPTAFLSGNPSLIGTVILCLLLTILLGFTLAVVGVLPLIQRLMLWGCGWTFGPLAELIGRNLQRHRRRYTTTALLFTLSVSLVIFIASLVALFSRTALAVVEHTHGADLRLQVPHAGSESLKADLGRLDGVRAVSAVQYLRSRSDAGIAYDVVMSDLVGMKHLWVVPFGVDPELAQVIYTNQIVWEAGTPQALLEVAAHPARQGQTAAAEGVRDQQEKAPHPGPLPVGRGEGATAEGRPRVNETPGQWGQNAAGRTNELPPLILSQAAARFLDVTAGDQVQLSFRLGSERSDGRFRVAAVCSAMPGFENFRGRVSHAVGSGLLLPLERFQMMTRPAPADAFQAMYFVQANGDAKAQKKLARQIREELDVRYRFGVQCTAEQKEQARILYWATQVFFGLLLVVAVVIAVFALIASMASTVLERRREIGVLKALGLRRQQLFRLFLGEAVVLTLSAGLAGGAIGFTLAWLFVLQAGLLMELATVFTLPYLTFIATFAISLLAAGLAAHLPTRSLLRKSAADILRL